MSKAKLDLESQLQAYGASKTALVPENWSAHLRRWPIYAAATGAALAAATSADAGTIVASGTSGSIASFGTAPLQLFESGRFIGIFGYLGAFAMGSSRSAFGFAELKIFGSLAKSGTAPLPFPPFPLLKMLSAGQSINSSLNWQPGTEAVRLGLFQAGASGTHSASAGWPSAFPRSGYAAMRFNSTSGGQHFFGYIQLSWGNGLENGVPTSLQAGNWAVSLGPLQAGETAVAEPGTMGLSLLALGFAGILAWRKSRRRA